MDASSPKRDVPQALFDAFIKSPRGRQAHAEAVAELNRTPRHLLDEGNPNHPMYDDKLFGYGVQEFLAKQY